VGLRAAALAEVRLDGCVVDAECVLPAGAAEMDAALAEERLLLATAVVAAADRVMRGTLAFAATRSFGPGQVLGDQQAVRHRLADLMADLEIAAAFGREGAGDLLRGALAPARAAAVMLVAMDAGRRIAEGCMQLMGARGFMADHPAARLYRDLLAVGLLAAGDPGALERAAAEGFEAASASAAPPARPASGAERAEASAHPAGALA
jgi:alkylation response protein AidB-like acyl-CoA dehydrogenase